MTNKIFIVNPVAGKGKAIKVYESVVSTFKLHNVFYIPYFTKGSNDAYQIARDKVKDGNTIYVIGGDGTLSEVAKGIIGTNKSLCLVPGGSGNDYYRSIKNIEAGKIIEVDVGTVNDSYFINSFSIGIDADICEKANNINNKYLPSSLKYDVSIINTLKEYNAKELEIFDKKELLTLLTITIGKYYGGGFKINPEAVLDDGLLDLTYVKELSKLQIINLMLKLIKGKHQTDSRVFSDKIKNMKIKGNNLTACIDGEIVRDNCFVIGIKEKALKLYRDDKIETKRFLF